MLKGTVQKKRQFWPSGGFHLAFKQGLFHSKRSKDQKRYKYINIFQLLLLISNNSFNYQVRKIWKLIPVHRDYNAVYCLVLAVVVTKL